MVSSSINWSNKTTDQKQLSQANKNLALQRAICRKRQAVAGSKIEDFCLANLSKSLYLKRSVAMQPHTLDHQGNPQRVMLHLCPMHRALIQSQTTDTTSKSQNQKNLDASVRQDASTSWGIGGSSGELQHWRQVCWKKCNPEMYHQIDTQISYI